jgi:UDP-N-acetylmuramate dehydrogenase
MRSAPAPTASSRGAAPIDWRVVAVEVGRVTGATVRIDEPLAAYTTMRVGGPADLLVEVRSVSALAAVLGFARSHGFPAAILGRGSDVVVSDSGMRGLVVLNRAADLRLDGERLVAASGVQLARAATAAERGGLAGLEFGLAIPGSVGGAVWANAGAHGSDIASVLESVDLLRSDGSTVTRPATALGLSYRDSRLKHRRPGVSDLAGAAGTATDRTADPAGGPNPDRSVAPDDIVLSAVFRLRHEPAETIRARAGEIRHWRREHQPLTRPSAGSIFRNPEGDSAGRLVEAAGLKGVREGGAMVSPKHANFIVNIGGASAADVRRLAERARDEVKARFAVTLDFEVEFVGDWSGWPEEAQ